MFIFVGIVVAACLPGLGQGTDQNVDDDDDADDGDEDDDDDGL